MTECELKKRMQKQARRVKVYDLRAEDKKNTALMYNPFLVEQTIDEAKKDLDDRLKTYREETRKRVRPGTMMIIQCDHIYAEWVKDWFVASS